MGYDLHITRSDWVHAEGQPGRITPEEWRRVAESDPEFERQSDTEYCWPDCMGGWTFYYFEGTVSVKSPDNETIRKMFEVARMLNASVQGDDDEYYRETERGFEAFIDGEVRYSRDWDD